LSGRKKGKREEMASCEREKNKQTERKKEITTCQSDLARSTGKERKYPRPQEKGNRVKTLTRAGAEKHRPKSNSLGREKKEKEGRPAIGGEKKP